VKKLTMTIFALFVFTGFFVFIGFKKTSFEVKNLTNSTKILSAIIYADDTASKLRVSLFTDGGNEIKAGQRLAGVLNEYIHPFPFITGTSCINIEMVDKESEVKTTLPCPKAGSLLTLK
jgi:hypothetical protein